MLLPANLRAAKLAGAAGTESQHGVLCKDIVSFAQRAVIDPSFGRGSVFAVGELFKAWLKQVCVNAGHHLAQAPFARFSLAQEAAMETLYGELASRWQGEDWGSAGQAALGKFEYHVGMMSQLLHCMSCQPGDIEAMSDCALSALAVSSTSGSCSGAPW